MAILIDYSHALHRNIYPNAQEINENPDYLCHVMITQILSFAKLFGASRQNRVIICLDQSSWRKDYYLENKPKTSDYANQTYKGDRKKNEIIQNWDEVYRISKEVTDELKKYSDFYVVSTQNAEGDDVIAVLTEYLKDKEDVFILSADGDMVQLQDTPRVNIYNPTTKTYLPTTDVAGYKLRHILIAKDDNIKSCLPRLGKKTVEKIIPQVDILLQTNPDMKERFEFNKNLIDFDYIPQEIRDSIISDFNNQEFCYNSTNLMKMCQKYKLVKLFDRLQEFKLPEAAVKTTLNQQFRETKINQQNATSSLEDFFS